MFGSLFQNNRVVRSSYFNKGDFSFKLASLFSVYDTLRNCSFVTAVCIHDISVCFKN